MSPDFDEIVGAESSDAERDRLRQVHELLVLAGPPPELNPRLAHLPETGSSSNVVALPRLPVRRRAVLLFAAALGVVVVFFGGYAAGNIHHTASPASLLPLRGTAQAPRASASLQIFPKQAGNWPMTLTVSNLPKLPAHAYYEVFLVRDGKPYLSCGEFITAGGSAPVTVKLNAPYVFEQGDTWIVTKQLPGQESAGQTVLKPV